MEELLVLVNLLQFHYMTNLIVRAILRLLRHLGSHLALMESKYQKSFVCFPPEQALRRQRNQIEKDELKSY